MDFNLKKTAICRGAKIAKNPLFVHGKALGILFLILSAILFIFFAAGVLTGKFTSAFLDKFLGGAVLAVSLGLLFLEIGIFFQSEIKTPKLFYSLYDFILRPNYLNPASFLDIDSARAMQKAFRIAKKHKLLKPNSTITLLSLISLKSAEINFIFKRGALSASELKQKIKKELLKLESGSGASADIIAAVNANATTSRGLDNFSQLILESAKIADKHKSQRITTGYILTALADREPIFKNFLINQDLSRDDILNLVLWRQNIVRTKEIKKRFWNKNNLAQKGSIGRDFASGFTITLDKYSIDLRDVIAKQGIRKFFGHKDEAKRVSAILEKNTLNNALLVGQPGVGRETVIENVCQRAFLGKETDGLNYKRFLRFDPSMAAARIASLEETEAALDRCFSEAVSAGNIVLVIDNFHNYISQTPAPGAVNVSAILSRYLPLSTFQIIAITSYDGLHKIIEKNGAILSMFEKVEVPELSARQTLIFLENYIPFFERKNNIFIEYKAIREIIELSARHLHDSPFPSKALRLLDEAIASLAAFSKKRVLKAEYIKKIVEQKTEIPLADLEQKEKSALLNLEGLIHKRIINQEEAVSYVASALRRARAQVRSRKGPMGSFLFLGPTGVGKTETSKALSAIYFGKEKRMSRLDMSEFQNQEDISRLIGSEQTEGLLTTPVRENPFCLVLLDELEKAHPNILDLFLQILDEGWVTDGLGRKIYFNNTIIIATSNAGAEIIRQDIQEDKRMDIIKDDLLDALFKRNIFRPEFINRFDSVVVFKPLTKNNMLAIAGLMLGKLRNNLEDKGIELDVSEALKEKVVEVGYNPAFGAREMTRIIQDKIENRLAEAILQGKLGRGKRVEINPNNFELLINNRE